MKRIILFGVMPAVAAILFAQQSQSPRPGFEVKSMFPHENPPGFYHQIEPAEVQNLADQGWELVSVMPYVYRNEERGTGNPKAIVTQTYPAYFFKRPKAVR